MNNLKINGSTEFMGVSLPIIEGGFGEDKRSILVDLIADVHNSEVKEINKSVKRLIDKDRIKEGIHYIDLKQVTDGNLFIEELKSQGVLSQAQIGNSRNIFLLSERGYVSLIKYMDDDKSWEVHDELMDHYFNLRQDVKTMLSETDKAILNIVNSKDSMEQAMAIRNFKEIVQKPLQEEIDKYERFLCNKLETLQKSQLATRLDTKPQTLAALFKKLKIYTSTSQVSVDFLRKFPDTKMIVETENTYINPKSGKEESKPDWQWTHEGAKALVDYLINLGKVIFCENKGFKIK